MVRLRPPRLQAAVDESQAEAHVEHRAAGGLHCRRVRFHERELGDTTSFPKNYKKHNIAYPKPYVINSDGLDHYGDKIRIFAKCITGGRPFEMCDIMLMTQSL